MEIIEKANKSISDFLSKYSPNTKVSCGIDFQYDISDDIVRWSFLSSEALDRQEETFCEFFEQELKCRKINSFVYSILHEFGHKMTINNFNEIQFDGYLSRVDEIEDMTFSKERDFLYYNLPIERAASEWARDFIEAHFDEIQEWFQNTFMLIIDEICNNFDECMKYVLDEEELING